MTYNKYFILIRGQDSSLSKLLRMKNLIIIHWNNLGAREVLKKSFQDYYNSRHLLHRLSCALKNYKSCLQSAPVKDLALFSLHHWLAQDKKQTECGNSLVHNRFWVLYIFCVRHNRFWNHHKWSLHSGRCSQQATFLFSWGFIMKVFPDTL